MRSAIQWRDTDPGAQTERRGGAGPVRGLLGGKTSPAAVFVSSFGERGMSDPWFFLMPHRSSLISRLLGPYRTSTTVLPVSELLWVSVAVIV